MKYNHQTCRDVIYQVWWKIVIRFDEMLFINFDEIHFVKFNETSFIRFDEMSLMFDESLSSRFDEFSSSINHLEKIRIKQSKHKRWDDQTWSRERIHKNIFARKKIWSRIFRSHFTFRNKMQNTLLTSSQQVAFFERNIFNLFAKKKDYQKKKL
jgi:hypothetical protein